MMHDSRSSQKTNYIIRDLLWSWSSLRRKRFREIWGQRKTEEQKKPNNNNNFIYPLFRLN